jgi:peptide/nickel transport system ATP-binding protein
LETSPHPNVAFKEQDRIAPLLTVEDLRVELPLSHGVLHPVRGVSFELQRGQTLGIVGESGCGKSLTALALMGLLPGAARITAAKLQLEGRDLLAMSQAELARTVRGSRVAMIFQEPMTSLNPVYTIGRQLTEAMTLHRQCTHAEALSRAIELLERVGISGAARRMGQYPHQISGGQRQRVMIAMALMNEPEVLIADEPTTALDVTIQAQILRLLAELKEELGMGLVLITHNLGIVSRVADRVAVMYAGEFVETGRTADLFSDPMHPYTRGLLAAIPKAGTSRASARLGSIRGIVPSLVGHIRGCAFAARCDYARAGCVEAPPVRTGGPERTYRCVMDVAEARAVRAVAAASPTSGARTFPERSVPLIAAQDIVCHFTVKRGLLGKAQRLSAVNGVTLEVRHGEVLALVGESGCGKTTLARVLLGLLPSQSGQVKYSGAPIEALGLRALARKVQPIFQDPYSSLNPRRTVGEIIRRPLDVHDVGSRDQRAGRVRDMMALVGLSERLLHSYPNQISGGQRQRAAIARAIVMHPEVVICDEPTSALDVSVQSQILNLLTDLLDELDLAYLLITHDLAVVRHMATRVAVMYLGEIVETGAASAVFESPRHPYTQALLASALTVTPGAGVPDNRMGASFPNALEMPSGCKFHPRCPAAMPICSSSSPPVTGTEEAFVRCHLYPVAGPAPYAASRAISITRRTSL